MSSMRTNGFRVESHRQYREIWEVMSEIIGFGIFTGFTDNKKNIEQLLPFIWKCVMSMVNAKRI